MLDTGWFAVRDTSSMALIWCTEGDETSAVVVVKEQSAGLVRDTESKEKMRTLDHVAA